MQTRQLASTGVQVSPLCLGTMMFGAWGEHRPRRVDPDHPRRARRGDQLRRHRRRLLARASRRRSSARRSPRPPRRRRPRHQGPRDDGRRTRTSAATRAAGSSRGREQPAPARHRLDRPLPDPPARARRPTSTRRSARSPTSSRAGKVRYFGCSTFPPTQIVEAQWVAERRGRERFITEQPPYSILVRGDREATCCPSAERYGMGVLPWSPLAGGWLTGRYRKGQDVARVATRGGDPAALRHVDPREPGEARRRRRARRARRGGRAHADRDGARLPARAPGVTAPIIGPRTMEQLESQLAAADVAPRRRASSTGSTRSSRRERPSTRPTTAGRRRRSTTRACAAGACRASS